jgi:hypothetical protein
LETSAALPGPGGETEEQAKAPVMGIWVTPSR